MRDQIYVKDYRKNIEIGAFQEERATTQELAFHVTLSLLPQRTDLDIVDDILSYDVIVDAIDFVISSKRYNLLETMAEDIAHILLAEAQVENVNVKIEKLGRIDGRLGINITRSEKQVLERHDEIKPMRAILINANSLPKIAVEEPVLIIPILTEFPNDGEISKRIYALQNDALAWKIAENYGLPLVDSLVEAKSLISRNMSFVRALGKQPFDVLPSLQVFDFKHFVWWHKSLIELETIEDHTNWNENDATIS